MSDMKYFDGAKWVTMKGDDGCDPQVTARVSRVITLDAGSNALGKVTVAGVACEPDLNFEFSIPRGADGKGWTGGSYDASTGIVTFTSDDGLEFTTGDLRGSDGVGSKGDKGDGWTGGSYDASNGIVTFTSADGLGFTTGDLRGSDGVGSKGDKGDGWTGGSYNASNGIVTFTSDDGLGFTTEDLRGSDGVGSKGDKGDGWTGGSYNSSDGIVTFTSADGLGFTTGDLRGSDGVGSKGDKGDGWTGGSYNASNGIVTFTSDDGLGFTTGDLRGSDGVGSKGDKGDGWTGGSYNASTGIVTFTSADGLGFVTGDLRGSDGVGTNGTSVDLTTVSVDTADCSVTPESSSGSFVADADGADGTKQYKLDLTLPRPPVVTTSETEPVDACDGDFWADNSEGGVLPSDEYRTLWGHWNGTFGTGSATDENGKLKSEGISSVAYISLGCYDVFFEQPFKDNQYCWFGTSGQVNQSAPATTIRAAGTGVIAAEKLRIFTCYIITTQTHLVDDGQVSVFIFDRMD